MSQMNWKKCQGCPWKQNPVVSNNIVNRHKINMFFIFNKKYSLSQKALGWET
jgi:hypothetical protein